MVILWADYSWILTIYTRWNFSLVFRWLSIASTARSFSFCFFDRWNLLNLKDIISISIVWWLFDFRFFILLASARRFLDLHHWCWISFFALFELALIIFSCQVEEIWFCCILVSLWASKVCIRSACPIYYPITFWLLCFTFLYR